MSAPHVDPELCAEILHALPLQTLLVDRELRVVHANESARSLLALGPGLELGAALGCVDAGDVGCGQGPRCGGCAIRRVARRALDGEPGRTRAFLLRADASGEPADLHLLVLGTPIERDGVPHAVLVLEDVDQILGDQGVVHVCAGCGRVEDEGDWHGLHRFLEDRLGLEVAGEPCGDCASKSARR